MAQLSEEFPGGRGSLSREDAAAHLPALAALYIVSLAFPAALVIGPFNMGIYRMIILALFIPHFVRLYTGRYDRIYLTDWMLLAYAAWYFIAYLVNHGLATVEFVGLNVVDSLGAYMLGRSAVRSAAQFRAMARWFFVTVLVTLPFAAAELFTGRLYLNELLEGVPGLRVHPDLTDEKRIGLFRTQGLFEHPILYGVFCAAAVGMIFVLFRTWLRSALMTLGVMMSLSSGPFVTLLVQAALLGWDRVLGAFAGRWKLLLALFVVAYIGVDILSTRSPIKVFVSYATLNPATGYWRLAIWEHGTQNVLDNPVFGLGNRDWVRPAWMGTGSVDNYWLLIAMRIGLPGIAALMAGFAGALIAVGRSRSADPRIDACRWGWILTLSALMFVMCTVYIWSATASMVFFLLGSGMWIIEAARRPAATAAAAPPRELRGHARWQGRAQDGPGDAALRRRR